MFLLKIINEEIIKFLNEYNDYDYDFYEHENELKYEILNDFLVNNNEYFSKRIYWRVVPALRLKKIWEDYIKTNLVRDIKGVDLIEAIMLRNTMNLDNFTELSDNPNGEFEEAWGDYVNDFINRIIPPTYDDLDQTEIPFDDPSLPHIKKQPKQRFEANYNYNIKNIPFEKYIEDHHDDLNYNDMHNDLMEILLDHFYDYYSIDTNGTAILSDYGTQPLVRLAVELSKEENYNQKIVIIDKMLNVVHQRSDLAAWFIEGGSKTLSDISGYYSDDEYSWNAKSNISGKTI